MPLPSYEAAPLSKMFLGIRCLQVICFAGIVAITANFVAEIVAAGATPPQEIVATLTIVCVRMESHVCGTDTVQTSFATLYCLISIFFFWARANVSLLVMAAFDSLLLIAFVVVSVLLGGPLSYLDCFEIRRASASVNAASALAFAQSLGANVGKYGNLLGWVGATRANCFETKSVWGLSISLWSVRRSLSL